MRKRLGFLFALMCIVAGRTRGQEAVIAPPESLVVDGVPKIPAALAETAGRYGSYRSATLADWNPERREMLIATRFADTAQLHLVKMPGGARTQLTSVVGARPEPLRGRGCAGPLPSTVCPSSRIVARRVLFDLTHGMIEDFSPRPEH